MPPAITSRQRILAALVARAEAIQAGDDFATDAGLNMTLGATLELGESDADYALNVVVGDEEATLPGQQLATSVTVPFEFQMLAKAGLDNAWLVIEAGIGDIKRAIEREDRQLGLGRIVRLIQRGPVRTLPREPGSTTVGAGVTYLVSYAETWGTP